MPSATRSTDPPAPPDYRELVYAALDVAANSAERVKALEARVAALTDELRRYVRAQVDA